MFDAVVFDFDGVIIESADIKTNAFYELFSEHKSHIDKIVGFHLENEGVSRYEKFRYIYSKILQKPVDEKIITQLGEEFSKIVYQKILECPFVKGAPELLSFLEDKSLMFIASGTPHDELCEIVKMRNIAHFFSEIHGSPSTKEEIISNILNKYSYDKSNVLFIGDAMTDYNAAIKTGVVFWGRTCTHKQTPFPDETIIYGDLSSICEELRKT